MAIVLLTSCSSFRSPSQPLQQESRRHSLQHSYLLLPKQRRSASVADSLFNSNLRSFGFGLASVLRQDVVNAKASLSGNTPNEDRLDNDDWKVENNSPWSSFLAKLAIALGIAAIITIASIWFKKPTLETFSGFPYVADVSSSSIPPASPVGFTFTVFGHRIELPEHTPGWIYFWLLMAAGCGLFISEEALNIWVGISLARTLCLDGSWKSFVESFLSKAPYIISTVLWVYWGVCISDMIPFYLGKLFSQTKASVDVCTKLGIGKEKAASITTSVQKYGNLIGFVERFSLGVRNPTAFLAGALGISPDCFFAGVCCGGLITLPIQLGIGLLLRERPLVAVASVATAVGIWTVFPYVLAASTALFLFLRERYAN